MLGAKELRKERDHSASHLNLRQHNVQPVFNPCGGCNACHQMTRIHPTSEVKDVSGEGVEKSELQKPCLTNFFQRNLGNSHLQSIQGAQISSMPATNLTGAVQRKCNCSGSEENEEEV